MSFGSSSRRLMQKSLESPRLNSRVWLMWDSRVNFSSSSILSLCFSIFGVPTCLSKRLHLRLLCTSENIVFGYEINRNFCMWTPPLTAFKTLFC